MKPRDERTTGETKRPQRCVETLGQVFAVTLGFAVNTPLLTAALIPGFPLPSGRAGGYGSLALCQ